MKKAKCPLCSERQVVARFDAFVDYDVSSSGGIVENGNIAEFECSPALECHACFGELACKDIAEANPGLNTEFIK